MGILLHRYQGLEQAKLDKTSLAHNNLKWDVLILPGVETLSQQAMERLVEFAQAGGSIIMLEALPKNTPDEFPSSFCESKVKGMLENKTVYPAVYFEETFDAKILNLLLEGLLDRDIILNDYTGILHSHRRVGSKEIYFIVNDTNAPKSVKAEFPFAKTLECWNPQTGDIQNIQPETTLTFGPYEGLIIRQVK